MLSLKRGIMAEPEGISPLNSIFIKNLKHYREKAKLSQAALSEKIDMNPNYITEIEIGRFFPNVEAIEAMANTLGIFPFVLFIDPNQKQSPDTVVLKGEVKKELKRIIDTLL
jgi:transcriptional regulator with XRE-family HTH domain